MGRKADLKRVDDVAREFGMDDIVRREFGDYLHECKQAGDFGDGNERGDFTMEQLREKAREFLRVEE